jgi:hypothetical protein
MGAATITVVGLFGAQIWYASYLDVSYHAEWNTAQTSAKVQEVRAKEAQALGSIDAAKQALAERGRRGFPKLQPQQSPDLGPMSGWIHLPGFSPYTPRAQAEPEPAAEQPAAPEGDAAVDGEAPAEGGAEAPEAAAPADQTGSEGEAAPEGESAPEAEAAPEGEAAGHEGSE